MSLWELLLIVIIAVVVIKPAQWPALIRFFTQAYLEVRRIVTGLQQSVTQAFSDESKPSSTEHQSTSDTSEPPTSR